MTRKIVARQSHLEGATCVLLVLAENAALLDLDRLEQETKAAALRALFVNPQQLIVAQELLEQMLELMQVAKQMRRLYLEIAKSSAELL